MEHKIINIRKNLKVAQDRKRIYADLKRIRKEFKIGDHVYLRVKPRKISLKLASCAKMEPRYCGSFEVLDKIGPVAYRISFPANMRAHNVFHVSFLKKYIHDPNHIIDWNVTLVEPKGYFQVEPMCILDKKVKLIQSR